MEHRFIKDGHKNSLSILVRDKVPLGNGTSSSCPLCRLTSRISNNGKTSMSNKDFYVVDHGHYCSYKKISKDIKIVDQQYLNHCLKLVQISAAKGASFSIYDTRCPTKTFASPGNVLIMDSLPTGSADLVLSPSATWISSSDTSSKNMVDIMRIPLFSPVRANDIHFIKGSINSYFYDSPGGFSVLSSSLAKGVPEKPKNESVDSYISSKLSTHISHGTLRCTWSNGVLHFMFSTDNRPDDVYVTRPSNFATNDLNRQEWMYLIHIRTSNAEVSDLVGRMNVSARYRICADSSKFIETESVIYGNIKCQEAQLANYSRDMGKHRQFPRKLSNLFKPGYLCEHRFNSEILGASTSVEPSPSKLGKDKEVGDFVVTKCPNLLEKNIASNFELAAIIIKEPIQTLQTETTEVSGWGMSFLKRAKEVKSTNCQPSTLETSMDILVTASNHGGPNTPNSGPSSLIERWKSGGKCDCGGWDTGCPISVLSVRPNADSKKSFNLFLKGDDEGRVPSMKMVNVQKGIYSIEFQPRLSALQCFSIAVAVIHSKCPTLRPRD